MDHHEIVDDWRKNAEAHDQENHVFLRSLKTRDYGFDPDEAAAELHRDAFQQIDCTQCANCCKTLEVRFSSEDVHKIAAYLDTTADELVSSLLESTEHDGLFRARTKPCPFLQDDNLCSIYEVRPINCHEYPYTDLGGFKYRTLNIINNTHACPATYFVVENLKRRARNDEKY